MMVSVAGEACAAASLSELAATLYPLLAGHTQRLAIRPFDCALTQRIAGMAAACSGQWAAAEAHFIEAQSQAERFPNLLDEPHVRHWYGKMLLDRGAPEDRDRGRELLTAAIEGYRRIGVPVRARMAEELLAEA
jgi:hypothetical protein